MVLPKKLVQLEPKKKITAYLVDVETGDYLDFQYNLNDIGDDKSTVFASRSILIFSSTENFLFFIPVRSRASKRLTTFPFSVILTFQVVQFKGVSSIAVLWK